MVRKILRFVIIFFILSANLSYAATKIWKWTDDRGGVHYSDDILNVPAKFRDKLKSISVKSNPSTGGAHYTGKPSKPHKQIKPKTNKLSTKNLLLLKEFIGHIKTEVIRDMKIITLVDNVIAFQETRALLEKDLPQKEKLLEKLRNSEIKIENEIKIISKNIDMENSIKKSLSVNLAIILSRMFTFKEAKDKIKQAIPVKETLIKDLENKIR